MRDRNSRLSYAARLSVNSRLTAQAQGRTQRNPLLLLVLSGLFLLRLAARRLLVVLLNEPPRKPCTLRYPYISGISLVMPFLSTRPTICLFRWFVRQYIYIGQALYILALKLIENKLVTYQTLHLL